jgi:hypothetical protein
MVCCLLYRYADNKKNGAGKAGGGRQEKKLCLEGSVVITFFSPLASYFKIREEKQNQMKGGAIWGKGGRQLVEMGPSPSPPVFVLSFLEKGEAGKAGRIKHGICLFFTIILNLS